MTYWTTVRLRGRTWPACRVNEAGKVQVFREGKGWRNAWTKNWTLPNAYISVRLRTRRGKAAWRSSLARIVLESFRGPRPPGSRIRFLDKDRYNCCLANLTYAPRRLGRGQRKRGLTERDVRNIRFLVGVVGVSQVSMAEKYKITQANVSHIVNNTTWSNV